MPDVKKLTPEERAARISKLEEQKGSLTELLDLQVEEFQEKLAELEDDRAKAVDFSTRLKILSKGGDGSVEIPVVLRDNPDKPKEATKCTVAIDKLLLAGRGSESAKRLLGQLADLFIEEKHQRVNAFLNENQAMQTEVNLRRTQPTA